MKFHTQIYKIWDTCSSHFDDRSIVYFAKKFGFDFMEAFSFKSSVWKLFVVDTNNSNNALVFEDGAGVLTLSLLDSYANIYVVAKDQNHYHFLKKRFSSKDNNQVQLFPSLGSCLNVCPDGLDLILICSMLSLNSSDVRKPFNILTNLLATTGSCVVYIDRLRLNRAGFYLFVNVFSKVREIIALRRLGLLLKLPSQSYLALPTVYLPGEIVDLSTIRFSMRGAKTFLKSLLCKLRCPYPFSGRIVVFGRQDGRRFSYFKLFFQQLNEHFRGDSLCVLQRVLTINPDGILLLIGYGDEEYIARVPLNAASVDRYENQYRSLCFLHTHYADLGRLIPEQIGQFKVGEQYFYLERKNSGVQVPLNEDNEPYTLSAVDWLLKFHLLTKENVMIGEHETTALISEPLSTIKSYIKCQQLRTKLIEIEKYLLTVFRNAEIPLVFMHGDYKIENILFNSNSQEIEGVIDWDLSLDRSFPVLDLLFLLSYNYCLTHPGVSFSQVIVSKFYFDQIEESEKILANKYFSGMDISLDFLKGFAVITWIYNISYRFGSYAKYDEDWLFENIESIVDILYQDLSE